MSTAHEVLAEVKAARIDEMARDAAQKKLIGRCWCPRYLVVLLSIWACVSAAHLGLLLAQYVKDPAHPRVALAVVVFANLALAIGTILIRLSMRNAALTELIRQNAPALYDELMEKGLF
jgi:hypothetical protein